MQHAYVYEGSAHTIKDLEHDARIRFGFINTKDPDVHVQNWDKFGIDEARALRGSALLKSSVGKALFILSITSASSDAQQALLKLSEEPQLGTIIILLVPHGLLLPALRSRFISYPIILESKDTFTSEVKKFLSSPNEVRSEIISNILKTETELRETIRNFINEIEKQLLSRIHIKEARNGLKEISFVRSYLYDRTPSYKMLMEHLSISLSIFNE